MKSSTKAEKGQRSIASFLFKPKGGTTPTDSQPKQRVLGEKQAAQNAPAVPPNKRPRLAPPQSQSKESTPLRKSSTKDTPKRTAILPTPSLGSAATANGHAQQDVDAAMLSASMQHTAPAAETAIPARVEQRHQRFQQKLVVGAGNKAERNARGVPAAVKPKYTPLELQIVELRERHPGVLLIVEVTEHACLQTGSCIQFTKQSAAERNTDLKLFLTCRLGTRCAFLGKMQVLLSLQQFQCTHQDSHSN